MWVPSVAPMACETSEISWKAATALAIFRIVLEYSLAILRKAWQNCLVIFTQLALLMQKLVAIVR